MTGIYESHSLPEEQASLPNALMLNAVYALLEVDPSIDLSRHSCNKGIAN
jgi:hypothetical protein